MPLIDRLRNRAVTRIQSVPRRARRRLKGELERQDFELKSAAGYRISGSLHRPAGEGSLPAVLLTPGTNDPGTVFLGWSQPINALELAATGCVAVHFDPAGRGESWGDEDYGGPEHQDNVRVVLRHILEHPWVDAGRVGVCSISLGLVMAVGALAKWPEALPVQWLVDWEGPCDREIICAGGRIMAPALGHGLDDEIYWGPREPARTVGALRCGYLRIQSDKDHAQPGELRHAERMIAAAAAGSLPWFQLNEHPRGQVPESPVWVPPGRNSANRALLRALQTLR